METRVKSLYICRVWNTGPLMLNQIEETKHGFDQCYIQWRIRGGHYFTPGRYIATSPYISDIAIFIDLFLYLPELARAIPKLPSPCFFIHPTLPRASPESSPSQPAFWATSDWVWSRDQCKQTKFGANILFFCW